MTVSTVENTASPGKEKFGIDLDRILAEEVGYGKYQLKAIALCGLVSMFVGYTGVSYVFTAARTNTRCVIPECEANDSQNFFSPWISSAVPAYGNTFDNCHRFTPLTSQNITVGSCQPEMFDRNSVIKCADYVYEQNNSAVYEFGLACDEWRWYFIGSSQVLGTVISLPVTGFVADRWGRRVALSVNCFNYAWMNAILYWSNSYTTFLIGGFFGKLLGGSAFTCTYILLLEYVRPKHRMTVMAIINTCLSVGSMMQGVVAWMVPDWRLLILSLFGPMLISVTFFWIMPESVRWLISKNRLKESRKILKKAAEMNGRVLSEKTLGSFLNENKIEIKGDGGERNLICLVFEHKAVLLRCVLAPFWWITTFLIHFGLRISSVGISGNKYVNFIAVTAVPIPAYWVAVLILTRIGRKPILVGGFWACTACLLGYVFVPRGNYIISLAMYLLGKFCISMVKVVNYTYTSELFPTRHRSRLVTYSSMFARIGEMTAPLTPALATRVWEPLPFVLFAGMSLVSGLLILLVPETLGTTLPETMEDANNLGRDQPSSVRRYLRRLTSRRQCYSLRQEK